MIRIYLLVIVLILAFFMLRWFLKTPSVLVAEYIKKTGLLLVVALLLVLVALGKLNWLFALVGVLVAFVVRLLPVLIRYAPQLQRLWILFTTAKRSTANKGYQTAGNSSMSKAQAYDILGLKPGATKQEIIQAHRKLMQKVHPDRGGSDFLAAQINQAKKILLDL